MKHIQLKELKDAANINTIYTPHRQPQGLDDFGDRATIGVHLKAGTGEHTRFGVFLGQLEFDDGIYYTVLCFDEASPVRVTHGEAYKTLAELKKDWRLD